MQRIPSRIRRIRAAGHDQCTVDSRRTHRSTPPPFLPPKAFTLIELLIVVAIIAILAAIAVPNFLEAQTRSKVSRARTDMRSVATALEAYRIDNNRYPYTPEDISVDIDGYGNLRADDMLTVPDSITTPISYISTHVPDVFKLGQRVTGVNTGSTGQPFDSGNPRDLTFLWLNMAQADPLAVSQGGTGTPQFGFFGSRAAWEATRNVWGEWRLSSIGPAATYVSSPDWGVPFVSVNSVYDPTNGTVSFGMIHRNQRDTEGTNQ